MSKERSKLSRRTLFAGTASAGALVAAAGLIPAVRRPDEAAPAERQPPERGGGYQLSEHVKRYYETTRL